MKKILLFSLAFVLSTPYIAMAGPIVRSGENISIDAEQTLGGDFYGLASTINISGTAQNDVYVAGGRVTTNAPVTGDLSVLGGTVQIHGDVGDDIRVFGGDVIIGKSVKGDVVVYGGTLTILSTASVEGDVLFWGNDLQIEGPVTGSVHGSSGSLRINAPVSGDIDFTSTKSLVFGDKASIKGNVTYTSNMDLIRAQGAVIEGNVHRIDVSATDTRDIFQLFVIIWVTVLFSALAIYFVARLFTTRILSKSPAHIGLYGLIGITGLIAIPLIAMVLMVSVVGIVIGMLVLASYFALLALSCALGVIYVGHSAQKLFFKQTAITIQTPILGSVIITSVLFVPFGAFAICAVIVMTFGVLIHTLYYKLRT